MSTQKTVICVVCPVGCEISASRTTGGDARPTGFGCSRGEEYARMELENPRRILTTTVRVRGGALPLLPVRTRTPIPREEMFAVMMRLADLVVEAPVKAGDVVAHNILGLDTDVIATRDVARR